MHETTRIQTPPEATAYSSHLVFWLNGRKVALENPNPATLLTDYLHGIGLTGTKVGCGQGGCGACTVMLSHHDAADGRADAPRGQRLPAAIVRGRRHDGDDDRRHRQRSRGTGSDRSTAIAAQNGTQCGFCTPGFVMNAHAFLQQQPDAFATTSRRHLRRQPLSLHRLPSDPSCAAHLRATTTTPARTAPRNAPSTPPSRSNAGLSWPASTWTCCRPPTPPRALHFSGGGREWYRPTTLAEVQRLKKQFVARGGPGAGQTRLRQHGGGSLSTGEATLSHRHLRASPNWGDSPTENGESTWGPPSRSSKLIDFATEVIGRRPAEQTAGLAALIRHAVFIAGYQVRCAGSVAGNIFMTRDHAQRGTPFPSDLFTVLATLGTAVTIGSQDYAGGQARLPADGDARRGGAARRRRIAVVSGSLHTCTASTYRPTGSPAGCKWRTPSSTRASASSSPPAAARAVEVTIILRRPGVHDRTAPARPSGSCRASRGIKTPCVRHWRCSGKR